MKWSSHRKAKAKNPSVRPLLLKTLTKKPTHLYHWEHPSATPGRSVTYFRWGWGEGTMGIFRKLGCQTLLKSESSYFIFLKEFLFWQGTKPNRCTQLMSSQASWGRRPVSCLLCSLPPAWVASKPPPDLFLLWHQTHVSFMLKSTLNTQLF